MSWSQFFSSSVLLGSTSPRTTLLPMVAALQPSQTCTSGTLPERLEQSCVQQQGKEPLPMMVGLQVGWRCVGGRRGWHPTQVTSAGCFLLCEQSACPAPKCLLGLVPAFKSCCMSKKTQWWLGGLFSLSPPKLNLSPPPPYNTAHFDVTACYGGDKDKIELYELLQEQPPLINASQA